MPGCLFSPLPPMSVRKITSPPAVSKEKDTKEKRGVGVCSRFKA